MPRRALPAVAAAVVLALTGLGEITAGASTSSAKSLAKDLMTTAYAKKAGFTEVAEKASTSAKTGVKSCPDGAQEAFEDGSNHSGVIAEVLDCQTKKAATALLTGVKAEGAKSSSPPKQLGSSAVERSSSGPVYTIYWRQGDVFEFVGLETQIPASSSSSTTTTTAPAPAPPITPAEQKILSDAAVNQFKRLG
jgi:Zn-dependent alcohol dehydrogenase